MRLCQVTLIDLDHSHAIVGKSATEMLINNSVSKMKIKTNFTGDSKWSWALAQGIWCWFGIWLVGNITHCLQTYVMGIKQMAFAE